MVERARLESECTVIPYRGFESLSLRQINKMSSFFTEFFLFMRCRELDFRTHVRQNRQERF